MLPIANSMKHPEQFLGWQCPNVLNTGMIVNTLLFTSVGFLGYIRYGDNVKANIVLELPSGHVLSQVAQVLIGFAILFTFGLQFYAPFETLFTKISHKIPAKNTNLAQILIRSATCILMGCLAMAIPHLQPFIGLMGSIFLSLLGLFIPCVIETVFIWPNFGVYHWKLIKNIILAIISIFALISGTIINVGGIVALYSSSSTHTSSTTD